MKWFSKVEAKLRVSVFYETLCPYSIQFFREQLIPTWEVLGQEYIDFRFIPYGNAHVSHAGNPEICQVQVQSLMETVLFCRRFSKEG